jgi:cation:H+ antiporter
MPWLQFLASAAILVLAALQLARYGDVIALRTGLGRLFMGTLLVGAVTSLPEFLVLLNALSTGLMDLAIGNLLGSNMFNILMLAILDLMHRQRRILRTAAMKHSLTGALWSSLSTPTFRMSSAWAR